MKINNLRLTERVELGAAGSLEQQIRAEFMLDDQGPFTITNPKPEFTREKLLSQAKELAEQISDLEGEEV